MRCRLIAALVLLGSFRAFAADVERLTIMPPQETNPIPATLLRPDGTGPFAAIVMMHDCSGLGPRSSGAPRRWARELVDLGHVVILPDSFSTRGFPEGICTTPQNEVNPTRRARDAAAARDALLERSFVDPTRIAVMGGSNGGSATLAALLQPGFTAAVALYPGCAFRYGGWSTRREARVSGPVVSYVGIFRPKAPLLILIGDLDNWTPAEHCRHLVEASRAAGYAVTLRVFPGAHHAFDSNAPLRHVAERNNPNAAGGRGATTGGDPQAWAQARHDVRLFLEEHLKRP